MLLMLLAAMNWIAMLMNARRVIFAACFVSRHDGDGGGPPAADTGDARPANGERDVTTVDENGRSTDAVLAALASVPGDIARLIEGKSSEELTQPAHDGGWGLVEILPHLRDWEEIIEQRVAMILAEDEPALDEYDDSLWAIEHAYREQDTRAAFEEFSSRRGALVERLAALGKEEWNRVGILPKRGRVTLHWLMNRVCDHDAKHVVQARDVLA